MEFDSVINTKVNEAGVVNVTIGDALLYGTAREAVRVLKLKGGADYETYKATKFPSGVATPESRLEAYVYALRTVTALFAASYNHEALKDD